MAKTVQTHFPVRKNLKGNIIAFAFSKKKKLSIYAIIFLAFCLFEFATFKGVQAGSRSYNFYLAILVMGLFMAEFSINRQFHIPLFDGIGLIVFSFFVFNVAVMLFSLDVNVSAGEITVLFQLPFYYICAEIFYRKKYLLKQFALLMTILGIIISIFILLNYVYIYQTFGYFSQLSSSGSYYRFLFTNANAMGYGVLMGMQFPLYMLPVVQKKWKNLLVLLLVVMTFGIIVTQSRTAIALLAITFTIFLFKKEIIRSRKIYLLIGIVVGFFLMNLFWSSFWFESVLNRFEMQYFMESEYGELGRFTWWPIVIKEWLKYPFFGMGHGMFVVQLDFFAHNTYLSILVERGLFTFIPYMLILVYFFRLSKRLISLAKPQDKHLFSALGGILIIHYVFSLTGDYQNSKYLWLIFSILTAERLKMLHLKIY